MLGARRVESARREGRGGGDVVIVRVFVFVVVVVGGEAE